MHKRAANLKHYFLHDINPVIRLLIISDTVMVGAAGLLGPIFALFIENYIKGEDIATVAGIAASIYLFTKSVLQIPIANLTDRIRGEKDDFWLMFFFTQAMAFIPLFYLTISTPFQLYVTQFFLGLCAAFVFPTYMAIFTRHIDKEKEGTEWGVYFTLTDLMSAALAAVGGYVASSQGFPLLIIIVVIVSSIGGFLLLPIRPYIRTAKH